MGLTSLLNVSKQGIYVSQGTLQTISHNISNVNTPGYSRQSATLENTSGDLNNPIGGGVKISQITRQFDELIQRREELGTAEIGRLESRERFLTMIEDVFNDLDGDGLSQRLDAFYTAADKLTDNPTNTVGREELVAEADALARYMHDMNQSLSELTMPVDQEINVVLEDINVRLGALQRINETIVSNENSHPALDLKDQRRKMILELGKIVDIRTFELPNDGIQVVTSKGQELLVDTSYSAQFKRSATTDENGFLGIEVNGRDFGINDRIQGGNLKGLIEIRDEVLYGDKGYITRLESIADEVRFQVNKVHAQTVNQTLYTSLTGIAELGSDLDSAVSSLVTDEKSANYVDSPVDLSRLEAAGGAITFATGTSTDNLDTIASVNITTSMSLREIKDAINNSGAVNASITTTGDKQYLKIEATTGKVFGVVSDTSNVLAALGVGGIFSGTGAKDMAVGADLLADSKLLGIGKLNSHGTNPPTTVTFDDGHSGGALALGDLREAEFTLSGDSTTLAAHYARLVGELGSVIRQDKESLLAQESAQKFISDLQESVAGVSLEEELTDLIRFQRSFQASSKMVGVADELMQTIISMV
ncbi:MAG: flagellar hook-associated protein FlgK [Magnetococcales bacterium]|nr:flagellar hook-associated protein FlgK [Magnetococcales bacterium]